VLSHFNWPLTQTGSRKEGAGERVWKNEKNGKGINRKKR
jgi:hypothetical protein